MPSRKTLLGEDTVPVVVDGVLSKGLALKPKEAFLLSRLDGVSTVKELCALTGLSRKSVSETLSKLNEMGLVKWPGASVEGRDGGPPAGETAHEEVELDGETRDMIDRKYWGIMGQDMYRILEVDKTATRDQIRKAYRKLAALYHPDRFFRLQIGSYKFKLEEICRKLREANEILSDDRARRVYNERLKEVRRRQSRDAGGTAKKRPAGINEHPLAKKVQKAKKCYRAAVQARKGGRLKEAYNSIKLAMTLDPAKPEYKEFAAILEAEVNKEKAVQYHGRGKASCLRGDIGGGLSDLKKAVELDPDSWIYRYDLAENLAAGGGDMEEAAKHARRAVFLSGGAGDCRYLFGLLLEKLGRNEEAAREYKKLLERGEKVQEAKERLAVVAKSGKSKKGGIF